LTPCGQSERARPRATRGRLPLLRAKHSLDTDEYPVALQDPRDLLSSVRATPDHQQARSLTHNREGLLPTIDQQALVEGEPALAQAADDVIQAKVDVREVLRGDTAKTWTIREVQDSIDGWSGTIVSLALMDMRRNGEVEMDNDLSIRVLALQTD
jgi:hypothetical protein